MGKKNKILPPSRRLELMRKRFDVDEENHIVKLNYHYDSVSEVLETNLGTKVASFDRAKFFDMKETISDFPIEYKADLSFQIDDYENHSPEEILESFDDAVELSFISAMKDHRKKWLQVVFCLIAGILVLYLVARGILGDWTGFDESTREILKEVFDITAWVFVWQAVSLMFLTPTEGRLVYLTLSKRVRDIRLLDKDGNVVKTERYEDSNLYGLGEKKKRSFARYLLLISGAAFFALGLISFIDIIELITMLVGVINTAPDPGSTALIFAILIAIGFVSVAFEVLSGLAGIGAFIDKLRKLHKFLIPFGVIIFLIEVTLLVYQIVSKANFTSSLLGTVISAAYLVGAIMLVATKKK